MSKNVPSVWTLQIFVRNRTLGGWPREKIAAAIKKRIKWEEIDPAVLDDASRVRYAALEKLLGELVEDYSGNSS